MSMQSTPASAAARPPVASGRVDDGAGRPMRTGIIVGVLFFGVLGGWAALAPLNSAAIAPGVVIVEGNRQAVQHRDGGIVAELPVREGDRVTAGQMLLRLDSTELRAQESVLSKQTDALTILEARLAAERDGLDAIVFPPAIMARLGQDGEIDQLVHGQERVFATRTRSRSNQVDILSQRIVQLEAQISGFKAQADANRRQLALIRDELKGTRSLYEKGLTPKTRVLALERAAASLDGERGENEANAARAAQAIGEARLQIDQIERERQTEVAEQLRQTQEQLFDLTPRLEAVRAQLGRTDVKAPASGAVVGLTAFTVGGVIRAGETIMEIVPSDAPLIVRAQLRPDQVDDVRHGMKAEVRLTAYPYRTTPVLDGSVSQVSADRLTDERTGVGYYDLHVEVPPSELARLPDATLTAGMPAEVMVPLRERTALDYLIEPLLHSIEGAAREE